MIWLLLTLGIVLLLAGGTSLVRGATGVAETYGISPLVVGLTVVAFGTSAPELVVNVIGALQGETALAFGNISGSNIANLGLVLGTAAVITPIAIEGQIIRRELPLLLLTSTILLVMMLDFRLRGEEPMLDRSDGVVLLLLFCIFLYMTFMDILRQSDDPLVLEIDELPLPTFTTPTSNWLFIGFGIAGLTIGGELTIIYGSELATTLGMAPVIIGMFVVAIGTSLPELATSIIAALHKEADLCVGNVIGSNIFNSLMVLPISALIHPLGVPEGGVGDIFVSLLFAGALVLVFIFGNSIMDRKTGVVFLIGYLGYAMYRIM